MIDRPDKYKTGDFQIAVNGKREVPEELEKITVNKLNENQRYKVDFFKKADDFTGFYHIIFISDWQSTKIDDILTKTQQKSSLIETEKSGLLHHGAAINFIPVNGLMTFELSKSNCLKNNLKINSRLETLAHSII